MNHSIENYNGLIMAFDQVHALEDEIIKIEQRSKDEKTLSLIFGMSEKDEIYEKMGKPMSIINSELLNGFGNVTSIEDFDRTVKFIRKIKSQNRGFNEDEMYEYISEQIRQLASMGIEEQEIDKILQVNRMKNEIEIKRKIDKIITEKDRNKAIITMHEDYDFFSDLLNIPAYREVFEQYFYPTSDGMEEGGLESVIEMAKLLEEHPEIDFNEISIERFNVDGNGIIIYSSIDGRKFALIDYREIHELQNETETSMVSTVELSGQEVRIQNGEEETIFYDAKNDEELDTISYEPVQSNYERIKQRLESTKNRVERLKSIGTPDILEHELKELEDKIMKRKEKAQSQNIEAQTGNEERKIDSQKLFSGITKELRDTAGLDAKEQQIKSRIRDIKDKITEADEVGEDR